MSLGYLGTNAGIEAHISLPGHPASVSAGRRFVRETLRAWGYEAFVDVAELATSELVTNAVLHAQSAPEIRVTERESRIRLEVSDTNPLQPTRKHYGPEAATGRGMALVEAIATVWGAEPSQVGKTVWCEFDVSGSEHVQRSEEMSG